MYQKGWMYNMILPWLTGGIAALDLFIKDEIEREGEEEFPRDLPGTKGLIRLHKSYNSGFPFGFFYKKGLCGPEDRPFHGPWRCYQQSL